MYLGVFLCVPAGEENCSRTLLQPSVMMNDCFPTRLHSVSLETEHLNTLASSPRKKGKGCMLGWHETSYSKIKNKQSMPHDAQTLALVDKFNDDPLVMVVQSTEKFEGNGSN